ncbi:MAG: hypothetical protein IJK64_09400 [Clostridia bacterium]|nr:hypothetical protein [Clostridia bacterium]
MTKRRKKRGRIVLLLLVILLAVYAASVTGLLTGEYLTESPARLSKIPAEELTDIGSPYKFYYRKLETVEQHVYNRILKDVYDMPEEIRVPAIDGTQLDHVFSALLYDNPDLFFVGRKCTLISRPIGTYCAIRYIIEPSEYEAQKQALDAVKTKVIAALSAPDDPWQTELEIHDYVVRHCSYEIEDGDLTYSSAYGALINGVAACEGYSKAAKLLLDAAGIENGLVSGQAKNSDGRTGAHMWNAVNVNGDFYHLDCTWDDPVGPDGKEVRLYAYFNLNDEAIGATHSEFSYDFGCTQMKENYYIKTGAYFESYGREDEARLATLIAGVLARGEDRIQLRFANANAYQTAARQLAKEQRIYAVLEAACEQAGESFSPKSLLYYKDDELRMLTFQLRSEE